MLVSHSNLYCQLSANYFNALGLLKSRHIIFSEKLAKLPLPNIGPIINIEENMNSQRDSHETLNANQQT